MKRKIYIISVLLLICSLTNAQYFEKVTGVPPANNFAKAYSASWNDYNNDGLDDLIQMDNNKKNTLFKNMGNGVFQKDTLNPIFTTTSVNTMGSCWGDYNNDGNVDLLLVNNMNSGAANHHNYLFRNDGLGMWTLITDSPVYTNHGSAIGASMADYDNDGFLDIYIVNTDTVNFLFHNNGNGTFTRNYTAAGPIVTDIAHHWTAVWADYDNDGWQDCYVVNYFATLPGENNALYHNNHDGTFSKDPSLSVNNDGATDQTASWGDYDNDGYLDLYTAAYTNTGGYSTHNYLYHNNGDGTFTFMSGLRPSIDGNQSFGSAWLDFNNDGRLDLVVANNKTADRHNYLYRNDGNGVFTNQTADPVVTDLLRSMGVSISDFDNNGYPDIYIDSWSSTTEPGMYRNKGGNNNWVQFKLEGTISNRSGIGARMTLWTGGQKQIREVASSTGQYCSSSFVQTIGLGTATVIDSVIIRWPSGLIQHVCNPTINQKITITEGTQQTGHNILSVTLPAQTGPASIDSASHIATCEVASSASLENLAPVLGLSPGATVIPASGSTQNFSAGPVVYKVFAEDCTNQNWQVFITQAPVVPVNQTVTNITVGEGQTTCYNATQKIMVAGNETIFTVDSGGSATFIAGESILFYPGTKVFDGGYMHGYITENGQYCSPLVNPAVFSPITDGVASNEPGIISGNITFNVFPNPTKGKFTMRLSGIPSEQNAEVEVYSLEGILILKKQIISGNDQEISIEHLRPGIYIIRIVSGNFVENRKLVKQ